jgi:very-short-patch-repair endonuclease
MFDSVLRRLARDHWVRLHGTPRVTVLVGGDHAREIWASWLALSDAAGGETAGETLLEGELDARIREAVRRATAEPARPIAVLASAEAASRWRAGRQDRLAAMADEGWTTVPDKPVTDRARPAVLDARSAAEATLFEALEATRATAGRFQLNETLSVRFGPAAAEIDLLSRADRIAIEIDGVHHFADLDAYRRDRRKDLLLQTQGFVVVRLLAEDVMRDVRSAVSWVCQVLAYRLKERGQ